LSKKCAYRRLISQVKLGSGTRDDLFGCVPGTEQLAHNGRPHHTAVTRNKDFGVLQRCVVIVHKIHATALPRTVCAQQN
jgi:hypothetical protein